MLQVMFSVQCFSNWSFPTTIFFTKGCTTLGQVVYHQDLHLQLHWKAGCKTGLRISSYNTVHTPKWKPHHFAFIWWPQIPPNIKHSDVSHWLALTSYTFQAFVLTNYRHLMLGLSKIWKLNGGKSSSDGLGNLDFQGTIALSYPLRVRVRAMGKR